MSFGIPELEYSRFNIRVDDWMQAGRQEAQAPQSHYLRHDTAGDGDNVRSALFAAGGTDGIHTIAADLLADHLWDRSNVLLYVGRIAQTLVLS
jgi:hypothetical protein